MIPVKFPNNSFFSLPASDCFPKPSPSPLRIFSPLISKIDISLTVCGYTLSSAN